MCEKFLFYFAALHILKNIQIVFSMKCIFGIQNNLFYLQICVNFKIIFNYYLCEEKNFKYRFLLALYARFFRNTNSIK